MYVVICLLFQHVLDAEDTVPEEPVAKQKPVVSGHSQGKKNTVSIMFLTPAELHNHYFEIVTWFFLSIVLRLLKAVFLPLKKNSMRVV